MTLSPRILDTLRQLGLTEYAARAYVALLGLKEAEASEIAEAAEVPRTKVYATLKDLADEGWATPLGGRPVRYRPAEPSVRIARAMERLEDEVEAATRELQARYSHGTETLPIAAYLVRGREALEAKGNDLIHRAREELVVNLGFVLPGEERALAKELRAARDRGVRVRLLLGPEVDPRAFGELASGARRAVFPFRGIICDWRQALLVLPGSDAVGVWNPTQGFMDLMGPVIRAAAETSPPLDS